MENFKTKVEETQVKIIKAIADIYGIKLYISEGSLFNTLTPGLNNVSDHACYNYGKSELSGGSDKNSSENVSFDEFVMRILRVGEKMKNTYKIAINLSYDAIITKENIIVGCQTISWDIIDKINEIRKKLG